MPWDSYAFLFLPLHIPKDLVEDNMFLFKANASVTFENSFEVGDKELTTEKWKEYMMCVGKCRLLSFLGYVFVFDVIVQYVKCMCCFRPFFVENWFD